MKHKGLRELIETDRVGKLPPAAADKIRKIIAFLQDMEREDELRTIQGWKAHRLAGNKRGSWSLFVTANWRITFRVAAGEIFDLNYEDYH